MLLLVLLWHTPIFANESPEKDLNHFQTVQHNTAIEWQIEKIPARNYFKTVNFATSKKGITDELMAKSEIFHRELEMAIAMVFLIILLFMIRMKYSNFSLSYSVDELTQTKLALLQANETLEEKVAKRTLSLNAELAKHKLLNQELEFGKERISLLMNSTAEGILAVDLHGRCIMVNESCLHMLGFENKDQVIGIKTCFVFGCEDECGDLCNKIQYLSNNLIDSKEAVFFRRDKSSFPVRCWGHSYSDTYVDQGVVITFIDITLRTKAEKALQREQDKYRRLVENLKEEYFFFIHNTEGVFSYVSPSITRVLGYQPEDFLSHYENYLANSPLNKIVTENTERALRGKKQASYDLEVFNKQGECRILEVSEALMFDEEHQIISVEGIAHDVTEKRQIVIERTNRNKVLEQLATGIALPNVLETIISTTEDSFSDIKCSILLFDDYRKHLHIGAAPSLPECYAQLVEVCNDKGLNLCTRGESGVTRLIIKDIAADPEMAHLFAEISQTANIRAYWCEPIISARAKLLGFFSIFHKQAKTPSGQEMEQLKNLANLAGLAIEKNQSELELNLAATTFQTHDAIIITDKNNNILRVNEAFTKITGYSVEDVVGKTPGILKSGLHDEKFYQDMWSCLNETGRFEGEIWNKRKDGTVFPERQMISAVKDAQGYLTHYVAVFSDITDQKAAENEIKHLAFYDALTDLPNRRLLLDRLSKDMLASKRHRTYGALLFLDLDHFKMINDSLGHHIGDELLKLVGGRLVSILREEDTAARIGGDEFVVLLPGNMSGRELAVEHSLTVANKVLAELSKPFILSNQVHYITPSIGVTVFPLHQFNSEDVLKQADTAMYRAKENGRNAVCFYQPEMQVVVEKRLGIELDLRKALTDNQLCLHYQAQVDSSGRLLSIEALLRWIHPQNGLISPAEFIPIAEESGMILQIGDWVLDIACQQIKNWNDRNFVMPHLAINVSPKQFHHPMFVQMVENKVAQYAIRPHQLLLEITEGVVIDRVNDTVEKMEALNAIGVGISIDDFGTGYSSLAYLKKLPVKQLKIDRSFVLDVTDDVNDAVIVETILSMAGHMGLDVVAEGVETREQMDFLMEKGCEKFQGLYFSKAVDAHSFEKKWFSGDDV